MLVIRLRNWGIVLAGVLLLVMAFAQPAHAAGRLAPVAVPSPRPYTGVPSAPPPRLVYAAPAISSLAGIWVGELNQTANIRRGAGLMYAVDRVWPQGRRVLVYATTLAPNGQPWYQVGHYPDPTLYVHAGLVHRVAALQLPAARHSGRSIDVNLTQQTLIAMQDGRPVLLAQVASGKAGYETSVGTWRIYARLPQQDMRGGGTGPGDPSYNLKDVPAVQYFHTAGQALHGTYWHDRFGRPQSHGCVNLSQEQALWLYRWATLGTPVVVHY